MTTQVPAHLDAGAIIMIAGAVVALVELLKHGGVPNRYGLAVVVVSSAFGVLLWGWSNDDLSRATAFDYFAGIVAVTTSSGGVYGLVRKMTPAEVTSTSRIPHPPVDEDRY